jgi:hypothetical protein
MAAAQVVASSEPAGTIEGIVVNGSRNDEPIGDADVLLRAGRDNHLEPIGLTKADPAGQFVFRVPLDSHLAFVAGADRDGIHYPANRFQLNDRHSIHRVTIRVFDAVDSPSPLRASRHEIDVNADQNVMTVRETLVIKNDSLNTYVGERVGGETPVTLRLRVPPNFDRVTFAKEFYGRRFRIVDHQLLTDIPWPPGERELSFTYRLPVDASGEQFRRALDVPCDQVIVRILGSSSKHVTCNLACAERSADGAVFAAKNKQLAPDFVIEAQIAAPSFPWMQCLRWGSLVLLFTLVLVTALTRKRRLRRAIVRGQSLGSRRAA